MRVWALTLLAIAVALTGCMESGPDPIVGQWKQAHRMGKIEFTPDGTCGGVPRFKEATCTWKRIGMGRYEVEFSAPIDVHRKDILIVGSDELWFEVAPNAPPRARVRFHRIK